MTAIVYTRMTVGIPVFEEIRSGLVMMCKRKRVWLPQLMHQADPAELITNESLPVDSATFSNGIKGALVLLRYPVR